MHLTAAFISACARRMFAVWCRGGRVHSAAAGHSAAPGEMDVAIVALRWAGMEREQDGILCELKPPR
eukprot:4212443-Pleurochrysis_carterae.AAC.2